MAISDIPTIKTAVETVLADDAPDGSIVPATHRPILVDLLDSLGHPQYLTSLVQDADGQKAGKIPAAAHTIDWAA